MTSGVLHLNMMLSSLIVSYARQDHNRRVPNELRAYLRHEWHADPSWIPVWIHSTEESLGKRARRRLLQRVGGARRPPAAGSASPEAARRRARGTDVHAEQAYLVGPGDAPEF
jgi:hypothetical protein